MLPVFLRLHFTATLAWLYISRRLYAELRHNYPRLYEKLGSPQFFMKRSFLTNFRMVRFLLRQDYESEVDAAVIELCQGLRALFYIYLICLVWCMILFVDKWGRGWLG